MNQEENKTLAAPTPEEEEQADELRRKVGLPRFFELLGRDLWSFYRASFLCCLGFLPGFVLMAFGLLAGSLPLGAVGGALAGLLGAPLLSGLLDTLLRALRDEPGFWWHTYKMAWKQNWKASLLPGLLFGLFAGVWVSLLFLCAGMENVPTSVWICLLVGLFIGMGFFSYLLVQVPLVDLPLGRMLKNAALMFIGFFPRTAAASLVQLVYWAAVLLYLPLTIPVLLVFGFWLPCLIAAMILYPGLDKVFQLEKTLRTRRDAELAERMAGSGPVFSHNDQ